jgi:NTF2 fold immunity protein
MGSARIAIICFMAATFAAAQGLDSSQNYRPPHGYVPDAATAIKIAVAVWVPIYGQKQIDSEKPYVATLKGDVWTVVGTFHCEGNCVGGVALIEISKRDGTILKVIHGM